MPCYIFFNEDRYTASMNVSIKRIDKDLPLPAYQTDGAAAFDLNSRVDIDVPREGVTVIPLGIVVDIPDGHVGLLFARSSLPGKKGLMVANGVGVIDADFCGDNDELGLAVINISSSVVKVEKGERLAQMIILPIDRVSLQEVSRMSGKDRGGFGTTGRK
ncbi:MAG: Deoxyuridine 5'-triphosphate nucleotidohydrolase [Microgenomates bacterium OLB22]|nr:MAG: Deoxyuridine 5'-triphosphate nucleotidohydrolase [Microgenomates bacterium OLB22]